MVERVRSQGDQDDSGRSRVLEGFLTKYSPWDLVLFYLARLSALEWEIEGMYRTKKVGMYSSRS